MIEAVQNRIERNARDIVGSAAELDRLKTPEVVNEYYSETPDGFVAAVRTQHRRGRDGSGGGFKVVEVQGMNLEDMLRESR